MAAERERARHDWIWTVRVLRALAVGVLVLSGALVASAADWRYVDLYRAGSSWDPASIQVDGDGSRNVRLSIPESIGGVYLTAVGTNTSLSGGAQPVNNTRGYMAVVREIPDCTLQDPVPIGCTGDEPSTECNYGEVGKSPEARPRRNGVWRRVQWTAIGCVYPSGDTVGTQFPLAKGVTTYTVSKLQRTVTPAVYRTIWDYQNNGDDFFNTCLDSENVGSIKQRGGNRYCTIVVRARKDVVRFRLTQKTVITERYPAKTCSALECR